jgi:Cu/Zn superoxide dismutase
MTNMNTSNYNFNMKESTKKSLIFSRSKMFYYTLLAFNILSVSSNRVNHIGTATITPFPGYNGPNVILGNVIVSSTENGQHYAYNVASLSSFSGSWYVDVGTSCENSVYLGGPYTSDSLDPTIEHEVVYTTDNGEVSGTATFENNPVDVSGHAIVFEETDGTRLGCGVIKTPIHFGRAIIQTYELDNVNPQKPITGIVDVYRSGLGSKFVYSFDGLEPNDYADWYVHAGLSCVDATAHVYYSEEDDHEGHYISTTPFVSDSNMDAICQNPVSDFCLNCVNEYMSNGCNIVPAGCFDCGDCADNLVNHNTCVLDNVNNLDIGDYDFTLNTMNNFGSYNFESYNSYDGHPHVHDDGFHPHNHDNYYYYYEDDEYSLDYDPWDNNNWYSNDDGVSRGNLDFSIFPLPVMEHAIVVNTPNSERTGCGVIDPVLHPVGTATITRYPNYDGPYEVKGVVRVSNKGSGTFYTYSLSGLEPNTDGVWHVHEGNSCDSHLLAGDAIHEIEETVPTIGFTRKGISDSLGYAVGTFDFSDIPLDVSGLVIVVHLSDGTSAGCGVIEPISVIGHASINRYPNYQGTQAIEGTFEVSTSGTGSEYNYFLRGLEPSSVGGWHVHMGTSCDDNNLVGGHYFTGSVQDPWSNIHWSSDSNGLASGKLDLYDYSLPVGGHAIVVHLSDGTRAGCGVIDVQNEHTNGHTHGHTHYPTSFPTLSPSPNPTTSPTPAPSNSPTHSPTPNPTTSPTPAPSPSPTHSPTPNPTLAPTSKPTSDPTNYPTTSPTYLTILYDTIYPTPGPTYPPTLIPTSEPTLSPTNQPTHSPTKNPTNQPTHSPTNNPTNQPTPSPTTTPTPSPTVVPSPSPTHSPSPAPTPSPTHSPTSSPTHSPTPAPTSSPTISPTPSPSQSPTKHPTPDPLLIYDERLSDGGIVGISAGNLAVGMGLGVIGMKMFTGASGAGASGAGASGAGVDGAGVDGAGSGELESRPQLEPDQNV